MEQWVRFKILVLTFKALSGQGTAYTSISPGLRLPIHPSKTDILTRSTSAGDPQPMGHPLSLKGIILAIFLKEIVSPTSCALVW